MSDTFKENLAWFKGHLTDYTYVCFFEGPVARDTFKNEGFIAARVADNMTLVAYKTEQEYLDAINKPNTKVMAGWPTGVEALDKGGPIPKTKESRVKFQDLPFVDKADIWKSVLEIVEGTRSGDRT